MHDVYIVFLKCVSSSPIDCTYPHPDEVAERAHKRLYHPAEGLHRDFQKKKNHLRSSISFQLDLSKIFLKQKHIVAVSFSLIQSIREHYNQNRPSKPIDQKHLHPNEVD